MISVEARLARFDIPEGKDNTWQKNALVHTDDENMTDVMKKTIKKLSDVTDEDFENTEFFLTV